MGSAEDDSPTSSWGTSPAIADVLLSVLAHPSAGWTARAAAPAVCSTWRRTLSQGGAFDRMLCQCLREEASLYVPEESDCPHPDGWKAFFRQIWPLRHTWTATPQPPEEQRRREEQEEMSFNISVAVRFRPANRTRPTNAAAEQSVTVPLHQRIQMLKLKHGCSRMQAMRMIAAENGATPMDSAGGSSPLDSPTVVYNRLYAGKQDEAPPPPEGLYEELEAKRKERVKLRPWLEGRTDTGVRTSNPQVAMRMGVRLSAAQTPNSDVTYTPAAVETLAAQRTEVQPVGSLSEAPKESKAQDAQTGMPREHAITFIESGFATKVEYDAWLRGEQVAQPLSKLADDADSRRAHAAQRKPSHPSDRARTFAIGTSRGHSARVAGAGPGSSTEKLEGMSGRDADVHGGVTKARIMSFDPSAREVVAMAPSVGVRAFNFSAVFPDNASQTEVHAASLVPIAPLGGSAQGRPGSRCIRASRHSSSRLPHRSCGGLLPKPYPPRMTLRVPSLLGVHFLCPSRRLRPSQWRQWLRACVWPDRRRQDAHHVWRRHRRSHCALPPGSRASCSRRGTQGHAHT